MDERTGECVLFDVLSVKNEKKGINICIIHKLSVILQSQKCNEGTLVPGYEQLPLGSAT